MTPHAGIEPRLLWWKASALKTASTLIEKKTIFHDNFMVSFLDNRNRVHWKQDIRLQQMQGENRENGITSLQQP